MMALYIPCTLRREPMMALSRLSVRANRRPVSSAWAGKPELLSGCTWLRSWRTARLPAIGAARSGRTHPKILAPQRAIRHSGLGERRVQVEHSPPAPAIRPGSSSPPSGSARVACRGRARCGGVYCHTAFHHHQRRLWRNIPENFHPALWLSMNPLALFPGRRRAPAHLGPRADGVHDRFLHAGLRRPAHPVGRRRKSPLAITITLSTCSSFYTGRRPRVQV